jgi:hypothetical protein
MARLDILSMPIDTHPRDRQFHRINLNQLRHRQSLPQASGTQLGNNYCHKVPPHTNGSRTEK